MGNYIWDRGEESKPGGGREGGEGTLGWWSGRRASESGWDCRAVQSLFRRTNKPNKMVSEVKCSDKGDEGEWTFGSGDRVDDSKREVNVKTNERDR